MEFFSVAARMRAPDATQYHRVDAETHEAFHRAVTTLGYQAVMWQSGEDCHYGHTLPARAFGAPCHVWTMAGARRAPEQERERIPTALASRSHPAVLALRSVHFGP